MKQSCKMQVGGLWLDGEIDISVIKAPVETKDAINLLRLYIEKRLTWTVTTETNVVEGSLLEPITDESRLLEE